MYSKIENRNEDIDLDILSIDQEDEEVKESPKKVNIPTKQREPVFSSPDSPKKHIKEKIKLKSETLIKEVSTLQDFYFDEAVTSVTKTEYPPSPKRFMSSRIAQNDAKALNDNYDIIINNKFKSDDSIDENFFSSRDGKNESCDDLIKTLQDKLKFIETKVTSLESENKKSKDVINQKNKQINTLIEENNISNSERQREKRLMEAKIFKLEQQNKQLNMETQ